MSLAVTWLDVFAVEPLSGNQLAVVHDADGLSDARMLALARETGLSETTFVQEPCAGGDYRNRIWWPRGELPFAGHPSLGTAVAVAHRRGERSVRYVQETPAGLQPIDVDLAERPDLPARASMLQEPAVFGPWLEPGPVAAAVGLEAGDVDRELSAQVVSTGVPHVLLALRDVDALERCAPDRAALTALLERSAATTLYAFVASAPAGHARARAFFDSPRGVVEDPATGSAAGPLCAYLDRHADCERVTVEQGAEVGRPSRLEAHVEGDRVRVAGDVYVIAVGELLT